jgi:hypothetical protein
MQVSGMINFFCFFFFFFFAKSHQWSAGEVDFASGEREIVNQIIDDSTFY